MCLYLSTCLSVSLSLSSAPASQSLWGDTQSKAEYTWLYYLELTNCLSPLPNHHPMYPWFPMHASPGCHMVLFPLSCIICMPRLVYFCLFLCYSLPVLALVLVSQLGSFSFDSGTCTCSPRPHPRFVLGCVLFPHPLYYVLRLACFLLLSSHTSPRRLSGQLGFCSDWGTQRSTSVIAPKVPFGMNLSLWPPPSEAPRLDQSSKGTAHLASCQSEMANLIGQGRGVRIDSKHFRISLRLVISGNL